jgi:tRNA(fMet)-specific endonuclease VapC
VKFLLDTNICIYIRQKKPEVRSRFVRLDMGDAAISVVTYGELLYGAAKSAHRDQAVRLISEFTTFVSVLPMAEGAGNAYGKIRAELERTGQAIGNNDLWIAAHALSAGLTLITNNEREFRRIPGLKIENWSR